MPLRDQPLRNVSLGAVQLAQAASVKDTARRLQCGPRTVSAWRGGSQIPSAHFQELMRQAFGVAPESWQRRADSAPLADAAVAALDAPEGLEDASDAADDSLDDAGSIPRLKAQIKRLQAARVEPGLLARTRLDYEALELKAESQLAKLVGITEAQILASAKWQGLCERVVATLESHPLALALLADGLSASEGTDMPQQVASLRESCAAQVSACEAANAALRHELARQLAEYHAAKAAQKAGA